MPKKLTVHLKDCVTDTYVEVDGERIETSAVVYTGVVGEALGNVQLMMANVEVVDERSGS